MGMVMGKAMTESMEKQQEFMQETQRVMLERNIQVICKKKKNQNGSLSLPLALIPRNSFRGF